MNFSARLGTRSLSPTDNKFFDNLGKILMTFQFVGPQYHRFFNLEYSRQVNQLYHPRINQASLIIITLRMGPNSKVHIIQHRQKLPKAFSSLKMGILNRIFVSLIKNFKSYLMSCNLLKLGIFGCHSCLLFIYIYLRKMM